MAQAKLVLNHDKKEVNAVIFTKDNGQTIGIPFDPANADYQEYLEWLAEGNEPISADQPE